MTSVLYSEEIEAQSIAILLNDASLFSLVEDVLERKSYGYPPFGIIYETFKDVIEADYYPDIITIVAELERKQYLSIIRLSNGLEGKDAIEHLKSLNPDSNLLESYAHQINDLYGNRKLLALSDDIRKAVENNVRPIKTLFEIDKRTGEISAYVGAQNKNVRDAKTVAQSSFEQYEGASNGNSRYIASNFAFIDDFTNGFHPQRVYMFTARSGEGKSALVDDLLNELSVNCGVRTAIFTMEMSAEEVHNRLIQIRTGISPLVTESGKIPKEKLSSFREATKKIAESPIIYDDSPELSLGILRTKIRKVAGQGAKVIFIDQLEQLTLGGQGNNQAEYIKLNYIAYRIKAYAREMDIPIVLVHQLNRAIEKQGQGVSDQEERDPQTSDLTQAGEKAVDAILAIRNNKRGTNFHWIKNRQGRLGKRKVNWNGSHISFTDIPGTTEFPQFIQPELEKEKEIV